MSKPIVPLVKEDTKLWQQPPPEEPKESRAKIISPLKKDGLSRTASPNLFNNNNNNLAKTSEPQAQSSWKPKTYPAKVLFI